MQKDYQGNDCHAERYGFLLDLAIRHPTNFDRDDAKFICHIGEKEVMCARYPASLTNWERSKIEELCEKYSYLSTLMQPETPLPVTQLSLGI